MSDTLKPCPFCGVNAGMLFLPTCRPKTPYNPADRLYPVVRCMECCAETVGKNEDYRGGTAIAAWNRRASQAESQLSSLQAEVERYAVLKRAVNESSNGCLPECDSFAHAANCPEVSSAAWLEDRQREVERLRKAIELLYPDADERQDELIELGVLVRVPPNEDEQADWGIGPEDDWYVFAWSPRASPEGERSDG